MIDKVDKTAQKPYQKIVSDRVGCPFGRISFGLLVITLSAGLLYPGISFSSEETTCGLLKDSWLARHIDTILLENDVSAVTAVSADGGSQVEIQADKIDFLEVLWPTTGPTQRFHQVPLNRRIQIIETSDQFSFPPT